ncbi:MAG: hypothetical protein C4334_14220 [Pyrinomonas sp.]
MGTVWQTGKEMSELKLENCRLDNRFDILRCLGRGSYAEIFVARVVSPSDHLPPMVVIKALNTNLQGEPDAELERTLIENFQNEAKALDRVRHPNIISCLGRGTALDLDDRLFHYLVLEYLPGGDLAKLCNNRPLPLNQALFYLEQVCRGLSHAHARGVIHRDIKPQNLLLTEDRRTVKIADFGVAKIKLIETQEGIITKVGTEIYAAPEHHPASDTTPLDALSRATREHLTPAADVYSLAKTTFMLLAGRAPREFARRPVTRFPSEIACERWAPAVLRVLERATQNDPELRYQTVAEFWRELQAAVQEAQVEDLENAPTKLLVKDEETVVAKPRAERIEIARSAEQRPEEIGPKHPTGRHLDPSRIIVPIAGSIEQGSAQEATLQDGGASAAAPSNHFAARRRPLRWLATAAFISCFVFLLYATHNYVSSLRQGRTATATAENPSPIGRQLVATTDVNLRSGPSASYPRVGLAERGSVVRVLDARNNWLEVVIVEHGRPKEDPASLDRGWVNAIYFDPK